MKIVVFVTMCLFVTVPVLAAPAATLDVFAHPVKQGEISAAFERVIKSLKQNGDVTRAFKQKKKIAALRRPLVSTGLMFADKQGICWQTATPFTSAMMLSKEGVVQKVGTGKTDFKSASGHIEIRHFVKIMMALFSADKKILEKEFHVFFVKGDDGWKIGLKPSGKIMAKILSSILIEGDAELNGITINEANGDTTEIQVAPPAQKQDLSLKNCVK